MPVVAGGNRHSIKVLVIKGLADVLHLFWPGLLPLLDCVGLIRGLRRIGVDQIGDLHLLLAGPFADVAAAAAATAGDADANRVVGADDLARRLRAGNGKEWKGGAGGCRSLQKFASR